MSTESAQSITPQPDDTARPISGQTVLIGTVGDPITQIRAPELMNAWFAKNGIDAVWLPFHATAESFPTLVNGFRHIRNLAGFTVTVPHKPAAYRLVDRLTERARRVGAVNVVRPVENDLLLGDIVDGEGFIRGLRARGHDPHGANVWLVGAGGAGAAIAMALVDAGIARIAISDIDAKRAAELVSRIDAIGGPVKAAAGAPPTRGLDIAINATPLGMKPDDPLPFDPTSLDRRTLVAEVIMKPPRTALLEAAAERGSPTHEGRHMLDQQVQAYVDFFGLAKLARPAA